MKGQDNSADLQRVLALQIAKLCEAAYRRGFQHGHGAAQGKNGAPPPTDSDVYRWRFAPLDRAVSPPGMIDAGHRWDMIERALIDVDFDAPELRDILK